MTRRIPGYARGREALAWATPETPLQNDIFALCKALKLPVFHIPDSRRAPGSGYPDLTIAGPKGHLFWELKVENGKPSPAQCRWLTMLIVGGARVAVIRPSDWHSGLIERELHELAGKKAPRPLSRPARDLERKLLRLRTARLSRGWTQTDLAGRVGTTQSRVSEIECGVIGSDTDTVRRIVEELGIHDLAL